MCDPNPTKWQWCWGWCWGADSGRGCSQVWQLMMARVAAGGTDGGWGSNDGGGDFW